MPGGSFSTDVTAIRERARQQVEEGMVLLAAYVRADGTADFRGV